MRLAVLSSAVPDAGVAGLDIIFGFGEAFDGPDMKPFAVMDNAVEAASID